MCYVIYLSTSSPDDLGDLPTTYYRFYRLEPPFEEQDAGWLDELAYPHKWQLASRYGGCSCHYRHIQAGETPEFWPPQDWYPEEQDDIEATAEAYDLITRVVLAGHSVDVFDVDESVADEFGENDGNAPASDDLDPGPAVAVDVSVSQLPRDSFQFQVGRRLVFRA